MAWTPPIQRILHRLDMTDPDACWLWPGAQNTAGYGQVEISPDAGRRRTAMVHRIVYEHLAGPIPDGLVIDHLCRVPLCCNPRHLEPVTFRENILRGTSAAARHAAQTECLRGHEFDGIDSKGRRECSQCVAIRAQRRRGRAA